MPEHDWEKLLGGFAADTLTAEERQFLYRAALEDQRLFDALADEQALKELLADPAVRRRLLQRLDQLSGAGAGNRSSWPAWFRRPMNLALTGGLASAVIALVLGTKIYQDSLNRSAPSSATEETRPATPAMPSPPAAQAPAVHQAERGTRDRAPNLPSPADKQAAVESRTERDRATTAPSQEYSQGAAKRDPVASLEPRPQVDQAPAARQTTSDAVSSLDETRASSKDKQAAPSAASAVSPAPSARALFYAALPARADLPSAAAEQQAESLSQNAARGKAEERRMEAPMAEKKRAERSVGVLGKLSAGSQPAQPVLGLRYSLLMAGPGGLDLEVDPSTTVGQDDAPRLTVQTNQDGYLSVYRTGSSNETPTRLFPLEGDGRVTGRKTVVLPLAALFEGRSGSESARVFMVFSRSPRDPHEPPMAQPSPSLLIERVEPGQPGAPAEHAVYVAHPNPGQASILAVEAALSLRP
jgi:hypothetical protein